MTMNQRSDPDDVANMLANLDFDCNLGYREILQAESARQAAQRWPLFTRLFTENEPGQPQALQTHISASNGMP
jgi:hypothetical protein